MPNRKVKHIPPEMEDMFIYFCAIQPGCMQEPIQFRVQTSRTNLCKEYAYLIHKIRVAQQV